MILNTILMNYNQTAVFLQFPTTLWKFEFLKLIEIHFQNSVFEFINVLNIQFKNEFSAKPRS